MIFGKTEVKFNEMVLRAILVRRTYKVPFHTTVSMIAAQLNEKMISSKDPSMDSISIAKSDMGSPHIVAPLRIFL